MKLGNDYSNSNDPKLDGLKYQQYKKLMSPLRYSHLTTAQNKENFHEIKKVNNFNFMLQKISIFFNRLALLVFSSHHQWDNDKRLVKHLNKHLSTFFKPVDNQGDKYNKNFVNQQIIVSNDKISSIIGVVEEIYDELLNRKGHIKENSDLWVSHRAISALRNQLNKEKVNSEPNYRDGKLDLPSVHKPQSTPPTPTLPSYKQQTTPAEFPHRQPSHEQFSVYTQEPYTQKFKNDLDRARKELELLHNEIVFDDENFIDNCIEELQVLELHLLSKEISNGNSSLQGLEKRIEILKHELEISKNKPDHVKTSRAYDIAIETMETLINKLEKYPDLEAVSQLEKSTLEKISKLEEFSEEMKKLISVDNSQFVSGPSSNSSQFIGSNDNSSINAQGSEETNFKNEIDSLLNNYIIQLNENVDAGPMIIEQNDSNNVLLDWSELDKLVDDIIESIHIPEASESFFREMDDLIASLKEDFNDNSNTQEPDFKLKLQTLKSQEKQLPFDKMSSKVTEKLHFGLKPGDPSYKFSPPPKPKKVHLTKVQKVTNAKKETYKNLLDYLGARGYVSNEIYPNINLFQQNVPLFDIALVSKEDFDLFELLLAAGANINQVVDGDNAIDKFFKNKPVNEHTRFVNYLYQLAEKHDHADLRMLVAKWDKPASVSDASKKLNPVLTDLQDYLKAKYNYIDPITNIKSFQSKGHPYHFAVKNNDWILFEKLLVAGADIWQKDENGENAIEYGINTEKNNKIVEILEKHNSRK